MMVAMDLLKPWQKSIAAVAALKVLIGAVIIVAFIAARATTAVQHYSLMVANVAAFGFAATLLIVMGRRDLRASALGVAFLLTAAVFADNALKFVGPSPAWWPVRALFAWQVDAFTPYFLWLFVQEFPRVATFGARRRLPKVLMRAALALGISLLVINLVFFAASFAEAAATFRQALLPLTRSDQHGFYWILQYAFDVAGLAALLWKARVAPVTERRRVAILIGGLIVGIAPTIIWVFLSASVPHFKDAVPLRSAAWLIYPTLLSTPFTTAYAVLVHRALNVSLIIRRAIQYAFARYSVMALVAIPAAVLIVLVYRQRHQNMIELVQGSSGMLLLALVGFVMLVALGQRGLLERIDRRFFREQYDARQILNTLIETCRRAPTRAELAERLSAEVDRALHLTSISVLFVGDDGSFVSPRNDVRPLSVGSRLRETVALGRSILEIDLERGSGFAASLAVEDRYWIADAGARLLVPMTSADHEVVGLLALGEKKSELPFSDEDRIVLSTVASAAAMAVRSLAANPTVEVNPSARALTSSPPDAGTICALCHVFGEADAVSCRRCGGPMIRAAVPRVLAGKFRLLERVGEGGMGVVYRGVDLTLDRAVAIKALPQLRPDQAARLRREARAMAVIAHPNLALIYGAESWHGLPILVVEFLSGGTLAARLRSGPLSVSESLSIGVALADVMGALHRVGILHRDIKPSNIGFAADGTPKLLDFGLARLLSRASGPERQTMEKQVGRITLPSGELNVPSLRMTASVEGQVVGTPLYLSPEAIAGAEPDPAFDIWSICVVLFEAMTGVSPVEDSTAVGTLRRIKLCDVIDLAAVRPDADTNLVAFFRRAFSPIRSERPATALSLRDQLVALRGRLELSRDVALPRAADQRQTSRS